MLTRTKEFIKTTPLAKPFIYLKGKVTRPRTQNDEALLIATLLSRFNVPKFFVEIGFGGWEFNCAPLAYDWEGLLVDGDHYNITIADIILPKRVETLEIWVTLESLAEVRKRVRGREIGILSIDLDGNDYWFWENLIDLRPAILIAEYNSTYELRPVTAPYDPKFYYRDYEPPYYYGASLAALSHLASKNGYSLIEVSSSGVNAFFVRDDLLGPHDRPLDYRHAFKEQLMGDHSRAAERWDRIKHMPFVDVSQAAAG